MDRIVIDTNIYISAIFWGGKPREINVLGTLGLLLKAKKEGLLSSVKTSIDKILESGIWIKEDIALGILKDAGEE